MNENKNKNKKQVSIFQSSEKCVEKSRNGVQEVATRLAMESKERECRTTSSRVSPTVMKLRHENETQPLWRIKQNSFSLKA